VRYVGSVRDVMHIFVEPNADKIFDSVAIDVNETGIHEQKPETDEQWDELEHAAIGLAEAVNLIKMVGRPMAQPGEDEHRPRGAGIAAGADRGKGEPHAGKMEQVCERAAGPGGEDAEGSWRRRTSRACSMLAGISIRRARTATSNTGIPTTRRTASSGRGSTHGLQSAQRR
jgi:hypothetical protein